jgi:secreted PhoX family phosphatase
MSSSLHPDGRLNPSQSISNDSGNPSILELIEQRQLTRRGFLKGSLGATAGATAAAVLGSSIVDGVTNFAEAAPPPSGSIGFTSVPPNVVPMIDKVTVPDGYTAKVLVAWGDSLNLQPNWSTVGAMTKAIQEHCYGAHTDGMHYFPFPGILGNVRGLLVTNSEYVDPGLVCDTTTYGTDTITQDMVDAQLAGHGVNVVTVGKQFFGKDKGEWEIERLSPLNRRITGYTPCKISGPAAGHPLMQTPADPTGTRVLGTLNNCAHGYTPWGTYLACEENFNGYFGANGSFTQSTMEKRYGLTATGFGYRWYEADPRFDINANRNEPNRFGWIVEIDPRDPKSTPIKRTALGRTKHEGATVAVGDDNTVVVYLGDDERNDYVYKFVCEKKLKRHHSHANRNMLDKGTLHVAKFSSDGSGRWIPLLPGTIGVDFVALRDNANFAGTNDAEVLANILIKTRMAADAVGATMMDRPEWITVHPVTREVYMTLTNNSRRGNTPVSSNNPNGSTSAGGANPPVDAANPRPDNDYGHIIRWREDGGDVGATSFAWDIFVQCGDKATAKTLGASYTPGEFGGQTVGYQGNIVGDDYGAPDGIWFDRDGRLWIETDQAGDATGDWANIGGNMMLCANVATGETRRFLTGVPYCEVTGVVGTPDGRTMFVGIQHPGEDWSGSFTANSAWPDNGANGPTTFSGSTPAKPRSSVLVITKDDGGVVGT